jgi:hypothetical protein
MSLFSSSSKASQTTTNQQLGVSGSDIRAFGGVSGSSNVVAQSGTAIAGGLHGGTGAVFNIVSSDIAALESNQAIATTAINAANQTSIGALSVLQSTQSNAAALISEVQAGANQVALAATPVSAGEVATASTAALKPVLTVAVVIAAITAAVIVLKTFK